MNIEKTVRGRGARTILTFVIIVAAFALGYLLGGKGAPSDPALHTHQHAAHEPEADTVWTCSMHPQIRLPQPGKCPICFMDLIPAQREQRGAEMEAVSLRQIALSQDARKQAEVLVEPVSRRPVSVETRLLGKVDYDETRVSTITTRMAGRIDKLYVDYTGSTVTRGQPMASIYSPELLTAQAELIQAVRSIQELEKSGLTRVKEAARQTEQAAREKLRLLGLSHQQIEEAIRLGAPSDHITLHAPLGGVVIKKDVLEGMYVQTGTAIYTIADLSRVWVVLEAYESDLPWVKMGQQVEFQAEAYPGVSFKGAVVYIDPVVNENTRTIRVRLDVPNPGGRLKPGMFVRAVKRFKPDRTGEELVIPASAPLITGKRAIVYVQVPGKEGTYEGREIVLGPRAGDFYIVRQGLSEGDLVVTRGNFKMDSAVQLLAKPSMMSPAGVGVSPEHRHGPTTAGQRAPAVMPEADVPADFASQLPRLAEAYEALKAALQTRDLQKSREAYRVFHNVLGSADPTPLKGRSALVWKEAAMLLRNDSMLGGEADTQEEAGRLFQTLSDHYRLLREYFHLDHILQAQAVSASVPPEFKKGLGRLLEVYLDLQAALAADDYPTAKKAAEKLALSLKQMDMNSLKGDAHRVWMELLATLTEGAQTTTRARDIEALRKGFEPLSMGLAGAVERLGVDTKGPVFELFCPMAFNNRGASWLQKDEEVRNPYFGAAMFACGEVRRQLKKDRS